VHRLAIREHAKHEKVEFAEQVIPLERSHRRRWGNRKLSANHCQSIGTGRAVRLPHVNPPTRMWKVWPDALSRSVYGWLVITSLITSNWLEVAKRRSGK
jgi:hypothetical protein